MPDDPRVEQLLEELLDSGGTPEEACRACPELLPQVRAGWQRLRALKAEVGALFPPSPTSDGASPPPVPTAELPRIRGYEVQEELGRGGMGVVYKAWHQRLNRAVALKMLLAGPYARPEELERFLREAETVAGLPHTNIVQVHEAGDLDGRPYFTMEFVEGGSLAQKLAGTPQPARQAAALVAVVAEAVHAAHLRGIVHRDLKPSNILLTADGTPKLTDFGVALRLEGTARLTQSGAPLGTPSYMAPEQAEGKGKEVGPAADTYALGAILYELLTGRPPFRADTAAETLRQVIVQDPVPPSRLNAAVPRDVETICLKCLEKDPRRRYASAAALADDLHRFGRNEPIAARPVGPLGRGLRWVRRHPTGAALAVTALALVGLATGGGGWLVLQQAERRAELRKEVDIAVDQAVHLRQGFHFQEARKLLDAADERLELAGPDDLRSKVKQAQDDLKLVEDLDSARLRAATPVEGRFEPAGAEPLYEKALEHLGLSRPRKDGAKVAAQIRDSAVCVEIVAALDDWASITEDPARRAWLLEIASKADPGTSKDYLRKPELWQDAPTLAKRVQEIPVDKLSPQLATALGRALRKAGGDAVPLLSAAEACHPQDFWLNFELAWALHDSDRNADALQFYRAALVLRPGAPAYNGIGLALIRTARPEDAIGNLRQALKIDDKYAMAHYHLAIALGATGRHDEALSHFEKALKLDPKAPTAAGKNVGEGRRSNGPQGEAVSPLQKALGFEAKVLADYHYSLGRFLRLKSRHDEAMSQFRAAIQLNPKLWAAHLDLGRALREKGRLEEAIGQFQQTIELAPDSTLARSCLYECRYAAACAAVQTLAGQGPLETRLGEQERVGLRRQALDWLRANLEAVKDGKTAVGWPPPAWQTDPALSGVRDPAALAKLPDAEREPWHRVWADVAALAAGDPLVQGQTHAARRHWDKAADCFAQARKREAPDWKRGTKDDGNFSFDYAAVLLLSGDRPGYAKVCAYMVEGCASNPFMQPYYVARACTLTEGAVAEPSLPGHLAEADLKNAAGQFWSQTEQGALHYREGRFPQAVALFEQSLRADSKPGRAVLNWFWLALAQQRLGKADEARRWLAKATAWLDQYADGMPARAEEELGLDLHNWLEAHVLRREAEALIRPADPP